MKLFFVIDNNQPHASGGGFYALFMFASALAKQGHQVFIYAVHDLGWLNESDNLTLYYRPTINRSNRISRKLDKGLERVCDDYLLPKLITKFQPDWLLGVLKESAIKAVKLAQKHRVCVANFIYECPPWLRELYGEEAYQAGNKGYTKRLWEETKKAYKASDVLFPNSILSQSYNQRWLDGKIVSNPIYPGIDVETMPFEGESEKIDQSSVLFVGRLVEDKNVPFLIKAWKRLPQHITLNIVGTGPLMTALKEQAKELRNIVFHGYVNDQTLWRFFRSTDLLVCPTKFEGFGMPPMQSLYFEKPCLASDLPILQSIYGDYIDYFPLNDEQALIKGVLRLLKDTEYAHKKGREGREFILENFTWDQSAEGIVKALSAFKKSGNTC